MSSFVRGSARIRRLCQIAEEKSRLHNRPVVGCSRVVACVRFYKRSLKFFRRSLEKSLAFRRRCTPIRCLLADARASKSLGDPSWSLDPPRPRSWKLHESTRRRLPGNAWIMTGSRQPERDARPSRIKSSTNDESGQRARSDLYRVNFCPGDRWSLVACLFYSFSSRLVTFSKSSKSLEFNMFINLETQLKQNGWNRLPGFRIF